MFERRITGENVRDVLNNGIIIEDYPDDTPYPSKLVLGWCGGRPIHVVVAHNPVADEDVVVTVYEPEYASWTSDFKRRR
jgi:hypothetical protein